MFVFNVLNEKNYKLLKIRINKIKNKIKIINKSKAIRTFITY